MSFTITSIYFNWISGSEYNLSTTSLFLSLKKSKINKCNFSGDNFTIFIKFAFSSNIDSNCANEFSSFLNFDNVKFIQVKNLSSLFSIFEFSLIKIWITFS